MESEYKETHYRLKTIWKNMITRCYDKKSKDYKYYGEKGVSVYNGWKKSFSMFCVWALTNGYDSNLTLDRIDVNGDYCPENCRWVSMAMQNRNKSQTRNIEINGRVKCLKDWCNELGVNYYTVSQRIHRGKSEIEVLGINE